MAYDLTGKRVYVAGHKGMVGSAIVRRLASEGCEVLTADRSLDLHEQAAVREWYAANRPDAVIVAAAKIAGIELCQAYRRQHGCDFISAMPTNLYGPGDNFHPQNSHVLPALIRKAHEAKEAGLDSIEIWGTGTPRREFLHVDDLADGCVFLLKTYSGEEHVNLGSGTDLPIIEMAELVCDVVGFAGSITRDTSKPDGTPRKLMSGDRITGMGWAPKVGLKKGIADAYRAFLQGERKT